MSQPGMVSTSELAGKKYSLTLVGVQWGPSLSTVTILNDLYLLDDLISWMKFIILHPAHQFAVTFSRRPTLKRG